MSIIELPLIASHELAETLVEAAERRILARLAEDMAEQALIEECGLTEQEALWLLGAIHKEVN